MRICDVWRETRAGQTIQPFEDNGTALGPNKFEARGGLDGIVALRAALRRVAVTLMKIVNDIPWLAPGPRGGIGELRAPANSPRARSCPAGSSPPPHHAIVMVCIQWIGNGRTLNQQRHNGSHVHDRRKR